MKIGLDLKALEGLIGGDSEMEVQLRNNIVAEFSKKYLKGIVETGALAHVLRSIEESLMGEARALMGKKANLVRFNNFVFNDEYKEIIAKAVRDAFREQVSLSLREEVETHLAQAALRPRVAALVDALVDLEVKRQVETKMAKVLKGLG